MTRSKGLHQITIMKEITQANETDDSVINSADSMIDISKELSKVLGRTVKQGQNFRVVGYGATIVPRESGIETSPDGGFGCNVRLTYVPTTRHSANGWRDLKDHYWKQSSYRRGLAGTTRYDEFEVAMYESQINSRTSKVYVGGINDPEPEACILLGDYDDEDGLGTGHIAARHLYDAKWPVETGGELVETDLLFDDTIVYKPAKFSSRWPRTQTLGCSATFSADAFYNHDLLIDDIYPTGGIASSEVHFLPSDNHLDVLCGLMTCSAYTIAPDDENFLADSAYLYVTLWVEGWNSLARPPSRS